jgi:hypothetical protein
MYNGKYGNFNFELMSLYNKTSLALIPSGYKGGSPNGTLYSVLPANGNGDFDHTRTSSATRVNKDGLIESVASGVPRLDYPIVDGVVQDCPHLLLEPSRLNSITNSENLSSWSVGGGITINSDDEIAPDGTQTADKIEKTSQNYTFVRQSFTASTGVFSIFVKKGNHRYVGIRNNESNSISHSVFDFDTETFIVSQANRTLSFEKFPNGWYRLIDYVSVNDSNNFVGICISDSSGNEIGTSIPLNSYIYAWGGQRESGQTYPTSYIPTSGSTVTRSADVCDSAGTSAEFNDSEGVLFAETRGLNDTDTGNRYISITDGTAANSVMIQFRNNGELRTYNGGTGSSNTMFLEDVDLTETQKIAIKYGNSTSDYRLYLNGFQKTLYSLFSATPVTGLDELRFRYAPSGGSDFYGKTKQLMVFNQALTDSELEQITSYRSFDEMAKGQLYTIE